MPMEAEVVAIYDGFCTIETDRCYLSKEGRVILLPSYAEVYQDEDHHLYSEDLVMVRQLPPQQIS